MGFILILFFLPFFAFAKNYIEAEKITIDESFIKAIKAHFKYKNITGYAEKLKIIKQIKKFFLNDAIVEIDSLNWIAKFKKVILDKKEAEISYIEAFNPDGQIFKANHLSKKDKKTFIKNAYITPCEETFCWKARAKFVEMDDDYIILESPEMEVAKFKIPIPNLKIANKPSSGFLIPKLKRDYTDGVILKIPYYFYINKQKDFLMVPFLGKGIGLNALYRQHLGHSILNISAGGKYFFHDGAKKGAYLRLKSKEIENSPIDIDMLYITTSEGYSKWWDRSNKKRRSEIPSYIWVKPNKNLRMGWMQFLRHDKEDKYKFIPKLIFKKNSKFKNFTTRSEFQIESIVDEEQKLNAHFLFALRTKTYKFANWLHNYEVGVKFSGSDEMNVRPFFSSHIDGKAYDFGQISTIPYAEIKVIKKQEAQEHSLQNFYENLYDLQSQTGARIGFKNYYKNIGLDLAFKKQKHENKNVGILGLQYAKGGMHFGFEDHVGKHHNFNLIAGFENRRFKADTVYTTDKYNGIMHHQVMGSFNFTINENLDLKFGSTYRLKPLKKIIQSKLEYIYRHKCWNLSFGIAYDIEPLNKKIQSSKKPDQKMTFTFSIQMNGLNQFMELKKLSNMLAQKK